MIIPYKNFKAPTMKNLYSQSFNFSNHISVACIKCSFEKYNSITLNAIRILLPSVR